VIDEILQEVTMKSLLTYNPFEEGLVRIDPFEMLDSMFRDDGYFALDSRLPAMDVRETEKSYIFEAELPGMTETDLELTLKDRVLTLSTKKDEKREETKERYLVRERRSISFHRTFALPEDADEESVKAEFKNGVLTVEVGRKPEKAPRQITVKAA
jgi:HSP20 family protein